MPLHTSLQSRHLTISQAESGEAQYVGSDLYPGKIVDLCFCEVG
jgi:hypothetical protein